MRSCEIRPFNMQQTKGEFKKSNPIIDGDCLDTGGSSEVNHLLFFYGFTCINRKSVL
jgi:hypothetical protein